MCGTPRSIELTGWELADKSHPRVHVGIPAYVVANDHSEKTATTTDTLTEFLKTHHSIESIAALRARTILEQRSRSLALDVTPRLIYAAGTACEALVTSGVADYLEWQALEGPLFLNSNATKLDRVPCNKNDVFLFQLLIQKVP